MKKKLIVAVYRQESSSKDTFVGIFLKDLWGSPLFTIKTSLNRDDIVVENALISQLTESIFTFRHKVAIYFFDAYEIVKDHDQKKVYFFIKPERYLDIKVILEKIKL